MDCSKALKTRSVTIAVMITHRALGIAIMFAAVALFVIGFLYIRTAETAILAGHSISASGECIHPTGAKCAFEELNELAIPKYLALFADLVLFGFGLALFLWKKPEERVLAKAKKEASVLGGKEGTAFNLVTEAGGMMFQNELMEKLQVSKVKVTRLLDKLEAKGLVERRRRGMTNLVVLK
ncbi:MarR family transcriptional regulator [Candidatus Woesearchaeota archaeon]|nr:MarR family transcriptional regulator [Candidatus Woesearchaeota archaeon]